MTRVTRDNFPRDLSDGTSQPAFFFEFLNKSIRKWENNPRTNAYWQTADLEIVAFAGETNAMLSVISLR